MKNPVDMESPENHPAASYWLQLGNRGNLKSLEVIQGESTRSVYRLSISATPQQQTSQTEPKPDTTNAIIAKRAPREDIAKEAKFYLSLLPHLPMVPLQTYGVIEDENPAYSWLFMADAGNQSYNPDNPKHRVLAAEWLANLHIESGRRRPCGELDDRGPEHFFPFLLKALQTLQNWRNSPEIGDNDRPVLEDILGFCLRLEANWSGIEHFCDTMPKTLVHGDIKEDNMRIGGTQRRPILLVFDWHEGGWGVPALDLAKFLGYRVAPDFETYLKYWLETWPQHDIGAVRRLGYIGEIFRWIATVRWHLDDLGYGNIERATSRMRVYREWMKEIERAAPWRSNPALDSATWQATGKHWV